MIGFLATDCTVIDNAMNNNRNKIHKKHKHKTSKLALVTNKYYYNYFQLCSTSFISWDSPGNEKKRTFGDNWSGFFTGWKWLVLSNKWYERPTQSPSTDVNQSSSFLDPL